MGGDIRRQAEDLARFYSELTRRLPQHGVRDVAELLALYEQVRSAVSAISRQEISWAADQTQGLVEELVQMEASLQAVRRLKATLERQPEGPPGQGNRGRPVP